MSEEIRWKDGEVRAFDLNVGDVEIDEVEIDEVVQARLWRVHRRIAYESDWSVVMTALGEVAVDLLNLSELTASAVIIWGGTTEFYHHVEWCSGPRRKRELSSILGYDVEVQSALVKRGQAVIRYHEKEKVELFLPVGGDEFLGAFYLEGSAGESFSPQAWGRLMALFEPAAVQLMNGHRRARELRSCQEENRYFQERERRHYLVKDLVCESEVMRRVYDGLHERVSDDDPLWMTGEAGTGKELLARALHHLGDRQEGMLIRMGCADFPPEHVDFELFGCVASELIGAVAPRKGIFELARGGTVFLDEIDRLSPLIQGKLVRVVKEKEVRRIGDAVGRAVDARFIASSHRDLELLSSQGKFRRDLFELLKPHRMRVPPLRERKADILPLARTFLAKFAVRYDARCRAMDEELAEWMTSYRWPGNIREMQTFLEAAVLMFGDQEIIAAQDLPLCRIKS